MLQNPDPLLTSRESGMRLLTLMAFGALFLLFLSDCRLGQASAEEVVNPIEGQWRVRCENAVSSSPSAQICEASIQAGPPQGENGPNAEIALRPGAPFGRIKLTVSLPEGVWLPVGVSLVSGEKGPGLPLTFKRCLERCLADLDLSPAQANALKSETGQGRIEFQMLEGSYVTLSFPWSGFAEAFNKSIGN